MAENWNGNLALDFLGNYGSGSQDLISLYSLLPHSPSPSPSHPGMGWDGKGSPTSPPPYAIVSHIASPVSSASISFCDLFSLPAIADTYLASSPSSCCSLPQFAIHLPSLPTCPTITTIQRSMTALYTRALPGSARSTSYLYSPARCAAACIVFVTFCPSRHTPYALPHDTPLYIPLRCGICHVFSAASFSNT